MIKPRKQLTVDELKELKDEVRELHPILNLLLPKLPGIRQVRYNQGINELGADFVLAKDEPALKKTAYVGVIVKIGPIRQGNQEVHRQIKECFIERKLPDGTEIQIQEVWVLCTGEITENARKIFKKDYADKKVEFVDVQLLAQWLDELAPDAFVTTPPALQDLASRLLRELEIEDRNAFVVPGLECFYVEPDIARIEFDHRGYTSSLKKVGGIPALLQALLGTQFAVIEAGPGGGKSKLARELTSTVLNSKEFSDGSCMPLSIHSRDIILGATELLKSRVQSLREISDCTRAAQILLIIDGFDEIELSDRERSDHIALLREFSGDDGNVSIVLMSRPFDEAAVLGGRAQSIDAFQIKPLRGASALRLLTQVAKGIDVKRRLATDLKSSMLMRALDGAPIAYILLGRLIAENEHDLPSSLTELFQKYCEIFLGRWEISKGLRSQKEYEVLMESLTWLGRYCMENSLQKVAESEFANHISTFCKSRNVKVDTLELIAKACQRSGILFKDINGAVGFRHRAFAEYFYAKYLNGVKDLSLTDEVFSPYWVNSYFFYSGLLKDCPDYLNSLCSIELSEEPARLMRALNLGNFLMAAYMTPKVVTKRAIKLIVGDLSDIYLAACDPLTKSVLSQFSTMQLLGIICRLFCDQYGYEFFKDSIEEVIFEVEGEEKSERSAISLLMLYTAYKESGGELKFDDFIEAFGESLPFAVRLAIGHEADRMKSLSARVKKMDRNIRRSFVGKKGVNAFMDKLYKTPIRDLGDKMLR